MARKRKAPHCLQETRSVAAFKGGLTAGGADVRKPTNEFEVVRWYGAAGLSVIYTNRRARPHKMTGDAQAAWTAFVNDEPFDRQQPSQNWIGDEDARPVAISTADIVKRAAREPVTIVFLMEANAMPMREASLILLGLERDGLLARTGGEPGTAILWHPASPSSAIHLPAGA